MPLLVRHPDTPPGAIDAIEAELLRMPGGAVARFRAMGDLSRLVIPPPAARARTSGLWQTTCFEMFVAGSGTAYREFNYSPSGAWAAYEFADHRCGMRDIEAAVEIETSFDSRGLTLVATIKSEIENPANVGLTAIVLETDRVTRYWATAFAPGEPDFHAAAVRSLILDGVSAE